MRFRILFLLLSLCFSVEAQRSSFFFSTVQRVDQGVEIISGSNLDIVNRYIDLTFNPDVYHSTGGALQASDLQLIFSQNGGVATACSISSITNTSGGALVGGEQTVRINLSFTGNPSGVEEIEIKPSSEGSYKDGSGNICSTDDTSGEITVFLELDPFYKAGLVTLLSGGHSVPALPQRLVHNAWFTGSRTDGTLTEWDALFLLDYPGRFRHVNFITGALLGSDVGSPATTQFLGTRGASGAYINSGWIPSTHASKFTTIYNSVMAYVTNNAQSDGYVTGGRGAVNTGHNAIRPRATSDVYTGVVNANSSGIATSASGITNSVGTWMITRQSPPDANTVTRAFQNGVEVDDGANNTSALSSVAMFINAKNNAGTVSVIDESHDVLLVTYGSGLQATKAVQIHSRNQTLASDLAALLPNVSGRLYAVLGQSNADYSDGLLSDLTPEQAALYNNGPISIANGYDANVYIWENDQWEFLEAGVNGVERGTQYFGPIYPLMVAESEKYPGEDLFVVKEAVGGSGMYTNLGANNWLPNGAANTRYETFISKYNAAVAAMSSVTVYMPVWWFQGEQDATNETWANDYGPLYGGVNNESIVMTAIRAETNFDDFIVSQIFSAQPGFPAKIRAQKEENFANGLFGTLGGLVNADDLDIAGHFDIPDCITNAIRISQALPN